MSRLCLSCLLVAGCGSFSRAALFTDIPAFDLVAGEAADGVVLMCGGYDPAWTEDDLCDADDGESCEDDVFEGFGWYRSDSGPYGEYVEVAVTFEPELLDVEPPGAETAWRAAILRREGDGEGRIEQVSIAAMLPVDP